VHPNPSVSVSAVVLTNDGGRVALVRKHGTAAFIFPGGKPETGETGEHTALREMVEELGVELDIQDLINLGDFTTLAVNETDTALHSEVYMAQLPHEATAQAQAEIAELLWVTLGEIVLAEGDRTLERHPLKMSLEAFENLVGEELDALPDEMVGGLDNVVFAVEDRPEDGSMDLLGVYEGHDLPGRAGYDTSNCPTASCYAASRCWPCARMRRTCEKKSA